MKKLLFGVCCVLVALTAFDAKAGFLAVNGGQTNVALDTDLLEGLGLTITGADGVISPGTLPNSVAFPINPRSGSQPTTFVYDPATFPGPGSFAGTIEHSGTITFNETEPITVGDFTIGFDAARLGVLTSGFFVKDNADLDAILFDIQVTDFSTATPFELDIEGILRVSEEFNDILKVALEDPDLNVTGANVGDALVEAVSVPEPSTLALFLAGLIGLSLFRGLPRLTRASAA